MRNTPTITDRKYTFTFMNMPFLGNNLHLEQVFIIHFRKIHSGNQFSIFNVTVNA